MCKEQLQEFQSLGSCGVVLPISLCSSNITLFSCQGTWCFENWDAHPTEAFVNVVKNDMQGLKNGKWQARTKPSGQRKPKQGSLQYTCIYIIILYIYIYYLYIIYIYIIYYYLYIYIYMYIYIYYYIIYIGIILELWGFQDLWLLYTCLTSKYHALIEPWWQTIFPTSAEDRPFTWMCIFCCISFSTLQRRQEGKVSLDEVSGAFSSAQKHPAELRTVDIMIHDTLRISEMCQPLWLLSPCQSGQSALAPASVVQNSPQRNGPAVLPTIVIIHDRSSLNILTVNWWSMKNNKLCLCCTLQWTSMVNGSCTLVDCIFYCSGPHFGSSAGCETCCRGRWLAISDQCSFSDATRTKETWKKGWLSG